MVCAPSMSSPLAATHRGADPSILSPHARSSASPCRFPVPTQAYGLWRLSCQGAQAMPFCCPVLQDCPRCCNMHLGPEGCTLHKCVCRRSADQPLSLCNTDSAYRMTGRALTNLLQMAHVETVGTSYNRPQTMPLHVAKTLPPASNCCSAAHSWKPLHQPPPHISTTVRA
jgi:hypothetical protein